MVNSKQPNRVASVSIQVDKGRLRLGMPSYWYDGKRVYLALRVEDTPANRKVAEAKARQIELDYLTGTFDPTLEKYQPKTHLKVVPTPIAPIKKAFTVQELWEAYTVYRSSAVKATTKHYHSVFTKLFQKLPELPFSDALRVKQELELATTVGYVKRALGQLDAACKWGVKHKLIESNPYSGMAQDMPKFNYQLNPSPNAFTEAEMERVIHAFRTDERPGINYQHYTDLVEFWFLTGCRPSEAYGLQWKHVSDDFSHVRFERSITTSGGGIPMLMEGSKNNKKRKFPCNERLAELLKRRKGNSNCPEDLVFPGVKGGWITHNNFCNNAWTKVVDPIKPDTSPYACRDTFITLQILKGTPETAIAKWCDTSLEMIAKYYADATKLSQLRPK